ncbi:ATP-binding protein [Jatrophihabitans sp. YIM 134969]
MASPPEFAALLRDHRQTADLTLESLAERSGVSARAISDMERGRSRGPQARTVQALADALLLQGETRSAFTSAARRGRGRAGGSSGDGAGASAPLPDVDSLFVGREAERRRLADALVAAAGSRPVVVSGPGGIGKTSLVVRAARDVADRFEDGVDFVALRGQRGDPLAPEAVAGTLLVAHGTSPRDLPPGAAERFAALAELLGARRGLLVLDDARDEAQVRPLLAHRGGTSVVVTSRRALGGLDAADRASLSPMVDGDARQLLTQVLGDDHAASHRGLSELAAVCGRFPLALRIVANRLLSRPGWTVQTMIDRLADESVRLGRLRAGDVEVETAFEMSYAQLRPVERLVFRRAGLVDGPTWSAAGAGVLTELPEDVCDDVLDDLVELGLVTATPDGRYAFHDLLRLFARDRLVRDDEDRVVDLARSRWHTWLLTTAADAGRWFEPVRDDVPTPPRRAVVGDRELARGWLQDESMNWFAALQAAAAGGADHTVVDVAEALHWYSDLDPAWSGWFDVFDLARAAAHRLGDDALEATHTNYLAWVAIVRADGATTLARAERAGELARRADDAVQLAWSETYAAGAFALLGEPERALTAAENAVAAFERAGDRVGALQALVGTAQSLLYLGRPADAVERGAEVVDRLDAAAADLPVGMVAHTRATVLSIVALAHADLGRFDDARAAFDAAIDTWAAAGFASQRARTSVQWAEVLVRAGDPVRATEVAEAARELARTHDDEATVARAQRVLTDLGRA